MKYFRKEGCSIGMEDKNGNSGPKGITTIKPNIVNDYVIKCLAGEVDGGMDGGSNESLTNML